MRGNQLAPDRQIAQAGIELIGTDSVAADAEIVLAGAEALHAAGLARFSFDLTLPTLIQAMLDEAGIAGPARAALMRALDRKDAAAVARHGGSLAPVLTDLLLAAGPADRALAALAEARLGDVARPLADRLAETVGAIRARAPTLRLTVDPVEFRGLRYHTGVAVTIFAPNRHEELGRGGRYLCGDEPATGLTLYPDAILRAVPPRPRRPRVYLPADADPEAAASLRAQGYATIAALNGGNDEAEARSLGCSHILRGGKAVSLQSGEASMANVAVIGAQWGDEGKGKVVDWLASRAEIVVRFQGGHNAGHTLVVGNETYKLSLLPSGLVRGKLGIIGNGVVIDPAALFAEIERVSAQGLLVTPRTLRIADNAPLILPLHAALDRAREAARGDRKIGTTGRGIGPAYEDKVARRAIRVADLAEPDTISAKLDELLLHHNTLLAGLGAPTFEKSDLQDALLEIAPRLLPFAEPVWERLDEARRAGTRILFEGAQAVMLDVDHGTYPFVTSSNTVAATAASGAGLGPDAVGFVLGIAKAYSTRVGSGPFPTELTDAIGQRLGDRGNEFGTVTGRRRRCGWFDAALVRQAVKVGGIQGIALTKLDVLDGLR